MNESPQVDQSEVHGEMIRLMELLRTIVRMLGYTNRDVERRAGLNHATAVRYFRGEGEPKLEFVLGVTKAIGLDFWEFFDIAYPQRQEASPGGQRLRRLLNQLVPSSKPADKAPLEGKELAEVLEEMRRSLQALVDKDKEKK